MSKLRVIRQIGSHLWQNKKWWLFPALIILLILGMFLILANSAVLAPFIYSFF